MQKFNYHTHTSRCGHADFSVSDEEYVKMFINKGFDKIAFTDHCPHKEVIDKRGNMRMKYSQLEDYLNSIKSLKEKYKDKIEIESGFEVEYLPGLEDYLLELKSITNKLVLGQHFIYDKEGKDLQIFRYVQFDDEDLIRYANYIKRAIELGIPDIIVHPDLFMLARDNFGEKEKEVSKIICEAAQNYNIPLEINLTEAAMYLAKLKNDIRYPSKGFWDVAANYDVKVIYGVDAHYRYQVDKYEESIELVNKIIGEETINKLNFCETL